MDLEKVEYYTKPVILLENILMQRISRDNDWEAMFEMIGLRTNITEEEAELLDLDELNVVMAKISIAVQDSVTLTILGRQITPDENV